MATSLFYCQICTIFAAYFNYILYKMIGQIDILDYAKQYDSFSVKKMMNDIQAKGFSYSPNTIMTSLRRMIANGVLNKVQRGLYSISPKGNRQFIASYSKEMQELNRQISADFPFLNYCIWNVSDVKSYAHYALNLDIIYVDVEKEGLDTIFHTLIDNSSITRRVFKTPTSDDYTNYIIGIPSIVVRPLVTEAPLTTFADGSKRTTIEKMMVDVAVASDFEVLQGYETLRFYRSILDMNDINEKSLLRYASRRGCKEQIQKDLSEAKQHNIFD